MCGNTPLNVSAKEKLFYHMKKSTLRQTNTVHDGGGLKGAGLFDVSFAYPDAKAVFEHFTLELPESGVVAVMGGSGSGKTTLLRLLSGTLKPGGGEVRGIRGLRISTVFQEDRLLPWYTVLKNVSIVSDDETALAVLHEMELSDAIDKHINELSGGMQRRTALARALTYGGDLLLLDEPLKGLDEPLKARIVPRILARFDRIVLVTHSEAEIALFGAKSVHHIN